MLGFHLADCVNLSALPRFLVYAPKKVTKEESTPCRFNPSDLAQRWYGCGTRPDKPQKAWLVAEFKQSSPFNPAFAQASGVAVQ